MTSDLIKESPTSTRRGNLSPQIIGDGEMAELARSFDWARTPVGAGRAMVRHAPDDGQSDSRFAAPFVSVAGVGTTWYGRKGTAARWDLGDPSSENGTVVAVTLPIPSNSPNDFRGAVLSLLLSALNGKVGRFPGREATGNFADRIKSAGLQQACCDRRAVASGTVD